MSYTAAANAIGAGATVLGGLSGSKGTKERKLGVKYLEHGRQKAAGELQPWKQAGLGALEQYQNALAGGPSNVGYDQFQFNLNADPGFNFARDQAMQETERAMAARGYNRSGNLLNALVDRATGVGQQYADQAFSRQLGAWGANADRDRDIYGREQGHLNRLGGLTEMGYGASGALANQFMSDAMNKANIRGVGAAAAAQANDQFRINSLNNAAQGYLQNSLLDKYLGRGQQVTTPPTWQGWD